MQRVNFDELELDMGDGNLYLWQGHPFTGIAYELRPDGALWSEIKYVNGRRHGIARDWYPSGQLSSETTYFSGGCFGPDREWDENGRLRSETMREFNYPLRERKWDENGHLISETVLGPDSPYYSQLEERRKYHQVDPHQGLINGMKCTTSLAELGDDWL